VSVLKLKKAFIHAVKRDGAKKEYDIVVENSPDHVQLNPHMVSEIIENKQHQSRFGEEAGWHYYKVNTVVMSNGNEYHTAEPADEIERKWNEALQDRAVYKKPRSLSRQS
jgi:hypothetical protein